MSGATEAAAVLERAERARRGLRSLQFRVQIGWMVSRTVGTREVLVLWERSGNLRVTDAENRFGIIRTDSGFQKSTMGSFGGEPREEFHSASYCLREAETFLFPTLGLLLDGKKIVPPPAAENIRVSSNGVVSWRDPTERSETQIAFRRDSGFLLSQKVTYFSKSGKIVAELSETYSPISSSIPQGAFDVPLPLPDSQASPLKPAGKLPPKVDLSSAVRKALEDAAQAGASVRSLSGTSFFAAPPNTLQFEEFALKMPGKLVRREKRQPRQVNYRSDGKTFTYPHAEIVGAYSLGTSQPARSFVNSYMELPHRILTGEEWHPTSPGRTLAPQLVGDVLCDIVELEGAVISSDLRFFAVQTIAVGKTDRLLRKILQRYASGQGNFILYSFPELVVNPVLPASTFNLSGAKGAR